MTEDEVSRVVIGAAIEVHRTLGGPGLLESVYEEALVRELELRGLKVQRQVPFPVSYKGVELSGHLRLDLLVEGKVIVECKATRYNGPTDRAQARTYLRISKLKLALVINFGRPLVKDGIRRVTNQPK